MKVLKSFILLPVCYLAFSSIGHAEEAKTEQPKAEEHKMDHTETKSKDGKKSEMGSMMGDMDMGHMHKMMKKMHKMMMECKKEGQSSEMCGQKMKAKCEEKMQKSECAKMMEQENSSDKN